MYVVTLSVFHNLAIWLLYVNKPEPTTAMCHGAPGSNSMLWSLSERRGKKKLNLLLEKDVEVVPLDCWQSISQDVINGRQTTC